MPLDRRAERLIAMLAAGGRQTGETPAARREALSALARMADDASAPARTWQVEAGGPNGPIPLRVYEPEGVGAARLPGLVFFHGGGWVAGDFETHDGLCRRLALAAGCRLIAVDYRLAPEHPFPAAFDDCVAATGWVTEHAAELGIDAARLAVGGDSVGAGLAAAAASHFRDVGGPRIALLLLICPILDAEATSRSRAAYGEGYFLSQAAFQRDLDDYAGPAGARHDPRISPLNAGDLSGLPAAIVHTAEYDPFRDEGELYAVRLRDAGVPVRRTRHTGMIHYFYAMARAIPYAHEAGAMIGAELREAFAAPARAVLETG
jgi:acetyl esterase/lipase